MPIVIRCEACGKRYQVRQTLAGKQIKCQCGEPILVAIGSAARQQKATLSKPPAAAPRPANSPNRPRKRSATGTNGKSKESALLVWCGIVAAVLVMMIAVVVIVLTSTSSSNTTVAQGNNRNSNSKDDTGSSDNGKASSKDNNQHVTDNSPNGKKAPPKKLKPGEKVESEVAGDWRVEPDPALKTAGWPNERSPSFKLKGNTVTSSDVFSRLDSPYFSLFVNFLGNQKLEVYDLRNDAMLGEIPIKTGMASSNFTPSPDGKYVTTIQQDPRQCVVWSVKDAKQAASFPVLADAEIDYISKTKLLVLEGGTDKARIMEIKTGKQLLEFDLGQVFPDRGPFALSPGGRFLILTERLRFKDVKLRLFDLTDGSLAGMIELPKSRELQGGLFVDVSQDGSEFALLFDGDPAWVFSWDMKTGKLLDRTAITEYAERKKQISYDHARRTYRGNHLMFVPDKSGWLVQGHIYVDRKNGIKTWLVPKSGLSGYTGPYRFYGDQLLLFKFSDDVVPGGRGKVFLWFDWKKALSEAWS